MSENVSLVINPGPSKLIVRTKATGLLAKFAHDLEIVSNDVRGLATLTGDSWRAEVQIPIQSLRVAGTIVQGKLDVSKLSASDRSEIERKLRGEVLQGTREVIVRAMGANRQRAEATVSLATQSCRTNVTLRVTEPNDKTTLVSGQSTLSLSALGIAEIKGPLGAFKVNDSIEIAFELTLHPRQI